MYLIDAELPDSERLSKISDSVFQTESAKSLFLGQCQFRSIIEGRVHGL